VWIDPRTTTDPNLDMEDLYRTNYEATKLAIQRALTGKPTVDDIIKTRHTVKHDMFDASTGKWFR